MTDPSAAERVVVPPGRPILEAAAWVGHACWAELRLHEVLTAWLAVEADREQVPVLWSARADAAERAERWHRRLPVLREHPQETFVRPSSPAVARLFDGIAALDEPSGSVSRAGALAAVLRGLRLGYHRHESVAVGPADGPTATALNAALRSTFDVGGAEPAPAWTAAIAEVGGLP